MGTGGEVVWRLAAVLLRRREDLDRQRPCTDLRPGRPRERVRDADQYERDPRAAGVSADPAAVPGPVRPGGGRGPQPRGGLGPGRAALGRNAPARAVRDA